MLNGLLSWVAMRNPVSALRASLVKGFDHDEVVELMRKISANDLGIEEAWRQAALVSSEACYVPVCETSRFHICMFLLKPHARIPLHDHPGMTVVSRVMTGSLRVVSYDKQGRHEADLAEGASASLFPDVRNIHEFTAYDECTTILDVIVPPYQGPCTYFKVLDGRLQPIADPGFTCLHCDYSGLNPMAVL